jgi:two-component system response regulator CpxR
MGIPTENILLMDDDRNLCKRLIEYLTPEGFDVDLAHNRETGMKMVLNKKYSLIIVDIMLPDGDNHFSVLYYIRSRVRTPILVLSSRADDKDRIMGLEMGADDYLQKPFNPRELVARIRAILRRTRMEVEPKATHQIGERLRVGDIEMDIGTRVVLSSGKRISLTSVEFNILEILLRNAGRLISRKELVLQALNRSFSAYDRSIDVHVSKLRKKLGYEVSGTERIKSIRGEGYLYALTSVPDSESVT